MVSFCNPQQFIAAGIDVQFLVKWSVILNWYCHITHAPLESGDVHRCSIASELKLPEDILPGGKSRSSMVFTAPATGALMASRRSHGDT
jgi:hypothetical protein